MIDQTPWENYGPGNDPRCANCMMHVGFETTPVLGAKRNLGDTWKMLKWQLGGHMGGNPERTEHGNTPGNGHSGGSSTLMPPPPANNDLISSDGRLRVL
jgi:hypothetical protein